MAWVFKYYEDDTGGDSEYDPAQSSSPEPADEEIEEEGEVLTEESESCTLTGSSSGEEEYVQTVAVLKRKRRE